MISNVIEKRFPDGTYQLIYSSQLGGGREVPPAAEDHEPNKESSRKASVSRAIKNVFDLARSNSWDLMTTYTFNPDLVDSFSYEEVSKTMTTYNRRLKYAGISYPQEPSQEPCSCIS